MIPCCLDSGSVFHFGSVLDLGHNLGLEPELVVLDHNLDFVLGFDLDHNFAFDLVLGCDFDLDQSLGHFVLDSGFELGSDLELVPVDLGPDFELGYCLDLGKMNEMSSFG